MLSTSQAIRVVVSLKARLLFRGSGFQVAASVIGMLVGLAGGLVLAGFMLFNDEPDGPTIAMVVLSVIALMWLLGAIVFSGGEQLLDAGRFAMFALSTRSLAVGFYVAAFVGILAPVTAIVALSTLRYAPSIIGALLMLLAAIVMVITAIVSGRVGVGLLAGLSRGRRTREFAAGVAGLIGGGVGILAQFVLPALDLLTEDVRASLRSVLRWLPWGWAPEALARSAEGAVVAPLLLLVPSIAFAAALFLGWTELLNRSLQSRETNNTVEVDADLLPGWMRVFPRTPTVAVAARTLRQLRRDPRELLQLATLLPIAVVLGLPAREAIAAREPDVVLGAGAFGLFLGLTMQGVFASDGRSFGVDILALGDLTPVVAGKALARLAVALPFVVVVGIVLAALTGGWSRLFSAFSISIIALCATAAVGLQISVRFAHPLPNKVGTLNQTQNQGCATSLIAAIALAFAFLVAAVAIVPITLTTIVVSPLVGSLVSVVGLGYGIAVFWFGAKQAGRWANANAPEMFQQLSAAP